MSDVKRWLAMDEGCIECGEPSGVIGTFDTERDALNACEAARDRQKAGWSGQHAFEVYDLTVVTSEWAHDAV
jgi:hypothetical protein